jgi:protein-L-isoaspartate(D-aspartate) O-methyltransferase
VDDELSSARKRYAELLRRTSELRSERLVSALSVVPREDFMGPGPWKTMRFTFPLQYRDTPDANPVHLYDDVLVALDSARMLNNGLPSGLARWIDAMDIAEGDHVVHAGCGTGYYTAIIAHMVGSLGRVTAIEFDADLAARARESLRSFSQVEVIAGDATTYDASPSDVIFVNAGATHPHRLWLDSLKPNGRLVFPLVRWPGGAKFGLGNAGRGVMMWVQRLQSGHSARFLGPAGFYPCFGAIDGEADRRLGNALAANGLTNAHSLRRESHARDESCLLHGEGYCFSRLDPA